MKKQVIACLAAATVLGAAAQPVVLQTTTGVDAGLQWSGYRYQEPDIMKTSGPKLGISVGATRVFDGFYVSGQVRHASGDVDYTSNGTGSSPAHSDRLWELRANIGRDFAFNDFVLSPYAGLGYRTLDNDLRGWSSAGALGYRRESEYQYLALGASHRMRVGNAARLVSTLEYNHLLSGEQKSYMSDISPAYAAVFGDPVNKQKKGQGLRLSVDYEMARWSVGGFIGYWKVKESEPNFYNVGGVVLGLVEPKNNTREIGVSVKYRF